MKIELDRLLGQQYINLADTLLHRHIREGNGAKRAVLYEGRIYSYQDLVFAVARSAHVLCAHGLKPGDKVLLVIPDMPSFVISFFAILAAGGVAVLANPLLSSSDMTYMARHVDANMAIAHHAVIGKLSQIKADGATVISCGDYHHDCGELEKESASQHNTFEAVSTEASDLAYVLFSSGTTGKPKAVPRRHRDILYCAKAFAYEILGMNANDLVIAVPKLTFGYALGGSLLFALLEGAAVILFPQRTTAQIVAEQMERYCPSIFLGTPRIITEMLKTHRSLILSQLRIATSAGETLPPSVLERWNHEVQMPLLDGFGSTEAGHIFLSNLLQNPVAGSCGKCLSTYQVRLVDDKGQAIADGEVGRMCIAGPSVASEYLNDPERSASAFHDGWHISQDLFTRRNEVYRYFGRADDMIKKGCGDWVSPHEVEDELLALSTVSECAVVGIRTQSGVIALKAYIVSSRDTRMSEQLVAELIEHTRRCWPDFPHKHLDQVEFLEALPRNQSGKIQRYLLRQQTLTEFSYDC